MKKLTPDSPCTLKVFPSPNHNERQNNRRPDMVILHYTGMEHASEALLRLCNPVAEVSAHYFVFEDGRIIQLVPETRRAWHAGISFWKGETDINSCSIGIEIANPGHDGIARHNGLVTYPPLQIDAVINLTKDIQSRWQIKPQRILAHSDIAPDRKQDPGEHFPWRILHEAGIGHYVLPYLIKDGRFFQRGDQGQPVEALKIMFAFYGYKLEINKIYDATLEHVVTAFQRHFRPEKIDGIADLSTINTLKRLILDI